MKFLVGLIICIFSVRGVHAQRVCGTEQFVRAYTVQQRGENANPVSARDTIPNEIINIPVVVQTGHSFSGIIHKQTSVESFMSDAMKYSNAGGDDAWDSRRYLNIWVCNMFGRSLGFATMPGGDPAKDGVVINFDVFGTIGSLRPSFDKGRTATHEIGHWLGLKHLWGDDDCGSDDVDDTPPQRSYNFYCPSFPHTTVCSVNGNGDSAGPRDVKDEPKPATQGDVQMAEKPSAPRQASLSYLNLLPQLDADLRSFLPTRDERS
ncbi:MAG: hypothetical protein EOO88_52935 [Pedobacter sp.]|nr:MAG: hypothetical protein EOO88_52935 [Pedobacter sp.]